MSTFDGRRWLIRRAGSFMALCLGLSAYAQDPEIRHYRMLFAQAFDPAQEKFIHEALTAQDPGIRIWVDATAQSAEARTMVQLDPVALQNDLSLGGLLIDEFSLLGLDHSVLRSGAPEEAFPKFIDTGDLIEDNRRYDAAKATWILAHPEEYEQLTAPDPE
jgi:hypothetical protein